MGHSDKFCILSCAIQGTIVFPETCLLAPIFFTSRNSNSRLARGRVCPLPLLHGSFWSVTPEWGGIVPQNRLAPLGKWRTDLLLIFKLSQNLTGRRMFRSCPPNRLVLCIFFCRQHALKRISAAEKHYKSLPAHHKELINQMPAHFKKLRVCVDHNYQIIKLILQHIKNMFENRGNETLEVRLFPAFAFRTLESLTFLKLWYDLLERWGRIAFGVSNASRRLCTDSVGSDYLLHLVLPGPRISASQWVRHGQSENNIEAVCSWMELWRERWERSVLQASAWWDRSIVSTWQMVISFLESNSSASFWTLKFSNRWVLNKQTKKKKTSKN